MTRIPEPGIPPAQSDWIVSARAWRFYAVELRAGAAEIAGELVILSDRCTVTGDLLSDERVIACIDGAEEDVTATAPRGWPWRAVPEAEFRYLRDDAAYARRYAPHLPRANPTRRLTIADAPLPF